MTDAAPTDEFPDEISVTELKERLERGDPITLIDVREPWEWEFANLEPLGARLMPLRSIPDRLHELDPASEIVLYCRTGARSMRALEFLRAHGFDRLRNLVGGVAAWSEQIDASFPKY